MAMQRQIQENFWYKNPKERKKRKAELFLIHRPLYSNERSIGKARRRGSKKKIKKTSLTSWQFQGKSCGGFWSLVLNQSQENQSQKRHFLVVFYSTFATETERDRERERERDEKLLFQSSIWTVCNLTNSPKCPFLRGRWERGDWWVAFWWISGEDEGVCVKKVTSSCSWMLRVTARKTGLVSADGPTRLTRGSHLLR